MQSYASKTYNIAGANNCILKWIIYIHDRGAYILLRYNAFVLDLTHLTNHGYNLKVDSINRRYNPMSYAIERYVRKV